MPTNAASVSLSKTKLRPGCLAAAAVLFGQLLAHGVHSQLETNQPEWADTAPLARRSLLLDVAALGMRVVVVGDRGHVLVSENGGSKWTQARIPTRSMLTAIHIVDEQHIWVVGHDAVVLHSSDGGREWVLQHLAPELDRVLLDVWFADANHGIAVGAYGLLLETRDGGKSWQRRTISPEEPHLYAITEGVDRTLYIAGEIGSVYRSQDGGRSWTAVTSPYRGTFFGAVGLTDGTLLVFGLRGNLYRSENGGQTWRRLKTGTTASLMGGIERTDGAVVIVGLNGTVLVSRDGGRRFVAANRNERFQFANIGELSRGRLVAVGETGISHIDEIP